MTLSGCLYPYPISFITQTPIVLFLIDALSHIFMKAFAGYVSIGFITRTYVPLLGYFVLIFLENEQFFIILFLRICKKEIKGGGLLFEGGGSDSGRGRERSKRFDPNEKKSGTMVKKNPYRGGLLQNFQRHGNGIGVCG